MARDDRGTRERRRPSSRLLLPASVACLAMFATGVGPRPDGAVWAAGYDLVLYNAVYVLAAARCLVAARRVRTGRLAWLALGLGLLLSVSGNVVYSLVVVKLPTEPFPSVADALYLGCFVMHYLGVVGLLRTRVRRFSGSTWLDGAVGAFGAAAFGVAVLLGPALTVTGGDDVAALMTSLAYPVGDLLLLALVAAVSSVVGVRRDLTLWLLTGGLLVNFSVDVVYLDLVSRGGYVEGGPLDLAWLLSAVLIGAAAHRSEADVELGPDSLSARLGWRVLAVPLSFNAASVLVLVTHGPARASPVAAWLATACLLAALARTVVTFHELRAFHEAKAEARTDELTGLPNRRAFLERARVAVGDATAAHPAALLLLDLDGFKEVNDSLGHAAGDQLLRLVGPRLQEVLRSGETLVRLGGDEFAVLLPQADLDDAQSCAHRLRELLLEPFTVDGVRLHVGASIGVASAPVPAATVDELLRCADVAMYAAKSGRDGVRVYVPDPHAGDRLRRREELRAALARDELLVHLQPQVDLMDGAVVGVEALVRWQHPTRGLLMPADLLPAAEQAGLLRPLADAVLGLALSAAAGWWPAREVPVSVNLSAADVTDLDLPGKVAAALARHDLPPRRAADAPGCPATRTWPTPSRPLKVRGAAVDGLGRCADGADPGQRGEWT